MRGQTLVLFALSLLILTVMVLMTLGIGARIHERQEQQIVADAAAYSQAVLTARTYNSVSSLNRVLVAQMASIAAAQSLLSWTGFYHGTLNQARDVLMALEGQSSCGGSAVWGSARQKIMDEDRRLIEIWEPAGGGYGGVDGMDVKAADYIRFDLYRTALMIAEHQRLLHTYMKNQLVPASGPTLASELAQSARQGSPWRTSTGELYATGQLITQRELNDAAVPRQTHPRDMVQVTMATRGVESFSSSREWTSETNAMSAATFVERRINRVIDPSPLTINVTHFGTSYYGDDGPKRVGPNAFYGVAEHDGLDGEGLNRALWNQYADRIKNAPEDFRPWGVWGQDSGVITFLWPGQPASCRVSQPTEDSFGYLVTTHPRDQRDNHLWRRGYAFDYREWDDTLAHVAWRFWPERRHTFRDDPRTGGVNIWPAFVDYNAQKLNTDAPRANAFGQPKSLVNIRRNYAARTTQDPWEMRFGFDLTRDGKSSTQFDLRDQRSPANGLRRATAIAAGITYYHRGPASSGGADHSREPPNFLNPFWRATLAASDVDKSFNERGDDVIRTLNVDLNEPLQAQALQLLIDEDFEAVP